MWLVSLERRSQLAAIIRLTPECYGCDGAGCDGAGAATPRKPPPLSRILRRLGHTDAATNLGIALCVRCIATRRLLRSVLPTHVRRLAYLSSPCQPPGLLFTQAGQSQTGSPTPLPLTMLPLVFANANGFIRRVDEA